MQQLRLRSRLAPVDPRALPGSQRQTESRARKLRPVTASSPVQEAALFAATAFVATGEGEAVGRLKR